MSVWEGIKEGRKTGKQEKRKEGREDTKGMKYSFPYSGGNFQMYFSVVI